MRTFHFEMCTHLPYSQVHALLDPLSTGGGVASLEESAATLIDKDPCFFRLSFSKSSAISPLMLKVPSLALRPHSFVISLPTRLSYLLDDAYASSK